ncbi:MAG: hypothetical protein JNL41_09755 [Phenylobacterium sp.]|uniref:hypothetical protein n=1 Tax=Phenylobacterium sp. TaxID=1871053 RepID=UPI001A4D58D3|nr:hypothetical protein [Phenylobacterium sp.]
MHSTTKLASTLVALAGAGLLSACNGGSDDAPTTTRPAASPYAFEEAAANSALYVRVDRTGAPAVATALLSRGNLTITGVGGGVLNPANAANTFNDQRDQLNRGDPANDARDFAATFVAGPQSNSLKNIHFKLNAELRALGLTPCSTIPAGGAATNADVNVDTCVAQAAPAIIPDVIVFDANRPDGFPNGRTYDDPVADRILAAALLRLVPNGAAPAPHHIDSLLGVIDTWNGPAGQPCASPCRFTGDETNTFSPATFPFLRPAYP